MKLWIVMHHHKHGLDVFPVYQEDEPNDNQMEAAVEAGGGDFDPEESDGEGGHEWLEPKGPFDLPIDQPLRFALYAANGTPAKETALCSACALGDDGASLAYAREQASQADDVEPMSAFQPCDPALPCCHCEDKPQPGHCDWGHGASDIRVLPYGGGGNMLLCHEHYQQEARSRAEGGHPIPAWDDLERYDPS
jgi:hypothetical protein